MLATRSLSALLFAAFAFLATPPEQCHAALDGKLRLLPESRLSIEGRSNINRFSYRYTKMPEGSGGACLAELAALLPSLLNEPLALEIDAFDSGHQRMNRDLRQLLESDAHPHIIAVPLEFEGFDERGQSVPLSSDALSEIRARADFSIAGKSEPQVLSAKVERQENSVTLTGELEIDIADYGLEAPRALLGLIKVRPHITVSFHVVLQR